MSENSSARTWVIGARQRRDHEREPLRDPAGVDAGAVQGHAGLLGDGVELLALLGRRVEPAQRGDHVLARLQDGGHHRGVGEDRAVEDAVGLGGQQGVDVAGGGHAEVVAAQERAEVDSLLVRAVDPGPGQLELGVRPGPPPWRRGPLRRWPTGSPESSLATSFARSIGIVGNDATSAHAAPGRRQREHSGATISSATRSICSSARSKSETSEVPISSRQSCNRSTRAAARPERSAERPGAEALQRPGVW